MKQQPRLDETNLPVVRVNLRGHPFADVHHYLMEAAYAEILILNVRTGTARVRLYDENKQHLLSNYELSVRCISNDNKITVETP